MISDTEIERIGAEQFLSPHEVEKDYVHGWLLHAIYSRPLLADLLVLKGGNALRKGYMPATRFSKDLDFSCPSEINQALLEAELREVCAMVEKQTAVKFLDKTIVKNKNADISIDALEARIYFKGFYNEESVDLKAQLDVTQFDKIYLPVQNVPIIHPYSDAALCSKVIKCQKIEEILASKLTTLLHRRKVGDMFDLLHCLLIGGGYSVSRREVVSTFLRKSIFEPNPEAARREILDVPVSEYEEYWRTILAPKASIFNFSFVTSKFSEMVNSLFDALVAPLRQPNAGRQPVFGVGGGGLSGRGHAVSFFSGSFRDTIISAGRNRRMVELNYGGYRRLVEPYSIQYHVRKSDGTGNEYFWGYDTTGGSSGKTSIKQFFCDKIERVSQSDISFSPRYAVEF